MLKKWNFFNISSFFYRVSLLWIPLKYKLKATYVLLISKKKNQGTVTIRSKENHNSTMGTKFWSSVPYIWCSLRIVWVPEYLANSNSQALPFMRHIACLTGSGHLHSRVAALLNSHPSMGISNTFEHPWIAPIPIASWSLYRNTKPATWCKALTSLWPFLSLSFHHCGFSFTISHTWCPAPTSLQGSSAPQNQYHMGNSYTFLSEWR